MFKTLLLAWCPELEAYNITAVLCQLHWLPLKQKDLDTKESKVTWLKMNDQIVEIKAQWKESKQYIKTVIKLRVNSM